ncbi:MAG: exodeoxyribonuclease III [Chloroflexi bacterium]|nr:exodeoxyribonuclease III [Chloroflexota bacterium]
MTKILSWNVNGLRAIYKKGFLDWVESENPDIICLQETKAHPDQLPKEINPIKNYYAAFSSAEKKGYSGVAVYSKEQPKSINHGLGNPEFDNEGRTLIIEYESFVLLNIYYPNGKASKERLNYKLRFYDYFLEKVLNLKNAGKKIIICGDFNTAHKEIDLSRPKPNEGTSGFLPIERKWMDKFIKSGFIDTFRHFDKSPNNYTWWDMITRARERNVGWRIDYFFIDANSIDNLENAFIQYKVMGSDHCPTGIDIKY